MHAFWILGGLLHATAVLIIGFFVLFAASKSQGLLKLIGNLLGVWLFILAVLAVIAPVLMGGPGAGVMGPHHPWMHGGWGPGGSPPAAAPANAATNAATNDAAAK